jgi:hypothetical protein
MVINVTKDHIARGHPWSADTCPIALAIKEALPRTRVSVAHSSIKLNYFINIRLPLDVIERIVEYDVNGNMDPFELTLPNL